MGPSSGAGAGRGVGRAVTGRVVAVAIVVLCGVTGCSSSSHTSAATGTAVHVTERDFHIAASPTRVPAGDVVITVDNHGPDSHELIVVRARQGSSLPLRADGVTINEEALEKVEAGALEPGAPGSVRELRLHLKPGTYQLFCNMSGHFFGGMHTDLVVT
jgi:uncharacterized cupredoxin-like copper-binding protein